MVCFYRVSRQQGRQREALDALHRAVHISPEDPDPHVCLANIRNEMGDFGEAEFHYLKVVELNPGDANGYNNLGVFRNQQGKI